MKRLLRLSGVFCALFTSVSVAFSASTKEVQMVSYFPVPYAAYNTINVSNELQMGLSTGSTVNVGSSGMSAANSLYAPKASVADHAGTANINVSNVTAIDSTTDSGTGLSLGQGSGNATAQFKDVNVTSVAGSTTANKKVHAEAKTVSTQGSLTLFGKGLSTTTKTDTSYCEDANGNQIPAT